MDRSPTSCGVRSTGERSARSRRTPPSPHPPPRRADVRVEECTPQRRSAGRDRSESYVCMQAAAHTALWRAASGLRVEGSGPVPMVGCWWAAGGEIRGAVLEALPSVPWASGVRYLGRGIDPPSPPRALVVGRGWRARHPGPSPLADPVGGGPGQLACCHHRSRPFPTRPARSLARPPRTWRGGHRGVRASPRAHLVSQARNK